jgi:hypothetical protein
MPGDGKNEKVLASPGVVGVKELALSKLRVPASRLTASIAEELPCLWCKRTPILPADSLLMRPPCIMYPDFEASSVSSIAELDSWLCLEGPVSRLDVRLES